MQGYYVRAHYVRGSVVAEGPRDALSFEILSTAVQLWEKSSDVVKTQATKTETKTKTSTFKAKTETKTQRFKTKTETLRLKTKIETKTHDRELVKDNVGRAIKYFP